MIRYFSDADDSIEMTSPAGWVEINYVTIGPEPHPEKLLLHPEAGALVIDAIERIIRPQNNVLQLS